MIIIEKHKITYKNSMETKRRKISRKSSISRNKHEVISSSVQILGGGTHTDEDVTIVAIQYAVDDTNTNGPINPVAIENSRTGEDRE